MSMISENTALILIHFSGIAVIVLPTVLYASKKGGGIILHALQVTAAASVTGRAGVDLYKYYQQKVEEYNAKSGDDSNNPQVDNKPSGSENKPSPADGGDNNKPAPTDGSNSGSKDTSSK